jgi:hypothetical protein
MHGQAQLFPPEGGVMLGGVDDGDFHLFPMTRLRL